MKTIKTNRDIYATISVVGLLLTIVFILSQKIEAVIVCGGLTSISLILLFRQNRLLSAVKVISESRILTISSSIVTSEKEQKQIEETIVSTFGLLLGYKVYTWGCEGVYGVRLREVQIDKVHISLSFGEDEKMLCAKLLHGLKDRKNVEELAQKIWQETGVEVEIYNW